MLEEFIVTAVQSVCEIRETNAAVSIHLSPADAMNEEKKPVVKFHSKNGINQPFASLVMNSNSSFDKVIF